MGTEMQGSSDAAPKEAAKEPKGDSRLADHLRKHASEYLRHYPWEWSDEANELLKEAASVIDASATKQLFAYRLGVTHMKPEITNQELDEECESLAALLRDKFYVSSQQNLTRCPHVVGTTTQYCSLTPFTLTDAEREAVAVAAEAYADDHGERFAATLRGLLERLGGER